MEDYVPIVLNNEALETLLVFSSTISHHWAKVDKENNVVHLDLESAKRISLDASLDPMMRGTAALIIYAYGLGQKSANEAAARGVDHILKEGGGTYGDLIRGQLK